MALETTTLTGHLTALKPTPYRSTTSPTTCELPAQSQVFLVSCTMMSDLWLPPAQVLLDVPDQQGRDRAHGSGTFQRVRTLSFRQQHFCNSREVGWHVEQEAKVCGFASFSYITHYCTFWHTEDWPEAVSMETALKFLCSVRWRALKCFFLAFQESYVWKMYQERCWDFFPAGDCFRKQYEDQLG